MSHVYASPCYAGKSSLSHPSTTVSAGGVPIWAEEQRGEFVSVSDDIDADFCLRAKGDSMTGARIYDGDIVFIRRRPTPKIFAIPAPITPAAVHM